MLLDELADVVDGARRLRAAQEEQVLAVAGDPVEGRPQPRIAGQLGGPAALGDPGPEDLLANVLDLDRAGLVRQMGERRLHRDEAVEEVLLVVLEAEVQHVGLAAGRDVTGHLEGHRRLARALRATDQQELAGAEAGADGLVERGEPQRNGLVLADLAGRHLVIELDEHVECGAGGHAARGGIESPGLLGDNRVGGLGHAGFVLPVTIGVHRSTAFRDDSRPSAPLRRPEGTPLFR